MSSGQKTGLDDFIVAAQPEALVAFEALPRYRLADIEQLNEMCERWAFIKQPLGYLELQNLKLRAVHEYREIYSNRIAIVETTLKNGATKKTPTPLTKLFSESPLRDDVTYEGLTFIPNGPLVTPEREFNLFRPFEVEPRRGDVQPYLKLRDHLLRGQPPMIRSYVEWWFANRKRRPEIKPVNFILFTGRQGTGKGLFGEIMAAQFGPYYIEIPGKQFTMRFNKLWAERQLLVMVSELMQPDKREAADLIKMIISQRKGTVEPKFVDAYQLPDFIGYFITSNHPNPLYLEADDRRGFIVDVCKNLDVALARTPSDLSESVRAFSLDKSGRAAMSYYLNQIDLDQFKLHDEPPMTEAKRNVIELGSSGVERFICALYADPDQYWVGSDNQPKRCDLGEARDVMALPGAPIEVGHGKESVIGIAMHKAGMRKVNESQTVRTKNGVKNLWAFRNADRWLRATHDELVAHYDRTNEDTIRYNFKRGGTTDIIPDSVAVQIVNAKTAEDYEAIADFYKGRAKEAKQKAGTIRRAQANGTGESPDNDSPSKTRLNGTKRIPAKKQNGGTAEPSK